MNVLLAPDSYKDALSASHAVEALAEGVKRALPDATVIGCPLGDGGEGTLDALLDALEAEVREATVTGPLGQPRQAKWGWVPADGLAIVELAEASGIQHLTPEQRDAMTTTTFGTGELVLAALDAGAQRIILTLGGSATNDGGAGMLQALGGRLLDANGESLPRGGAALAQLARLELDGLDARLREVAVEVAVDVDNPLCGPRGASAVFGPQKGATPDQVETLDQALGHFAALTLEVTGRDVADRPGAGAAGGMGFAALAFLDAAPRPGIEIVMELVDFSRLLAKADLVITGEGGVDSQSLSGKTPIGVARAAKPLGVPVVLLAGRFGEGWRDIYGEGVTAAFPLTDAAMPLEQALARSAELLADRAEAVVRLFSAAQRG